MPDLTAPASPPPGRRRPTILDVAAAAGVSKGLVSKVLSGAAGPSAATTQRVLAVAERMGYRKDRTATLLAQRRTRLIGVTILPSNVYHGELAEEIQAMVDAAGYETVLGAITATHDERRSIETLIDFRCEALLLLGPTMPEVELAPLVEGVPTVCVGRPLDLPGVDVVRADDKQGIAEVVDHLVSLGHQHIAHVDGGTGHIAAVRRRAYRAAMRRHGLEAVVLPGGLTERQGAAALEHLPSGAGITAIVAFNDRTALGLLEALESRGIRVPDDMSVTGFDDSLMARHPRMALTTVSQSPIEQARLAVQAAIDRLNGDIEGRREIVLPTRLVVRGSTGPAR
ncbi:LacI family DNA-binding transcriptional regulator [Nonomuraea turcica]|uniref:LacI family DNA-binding transcriptional regulator n=1 Tax=Nonomuraea sp. G32 TaxID=3067274 RepID=UPI00273CB2E7|nr:LacI family DNA-binding transcriptional regulator [Nonomuraea sp. G32]MDP4510215.1 LacI family DNA-binding transcriptional regulator [Nonomuraea sp. G32]